MRLETGCYIDGQHGIYAIEKLLELAHSLLPDDMKGEANLEEADIIVRHGLYGEGEIVLPDGQTANVEECQDFTPELYNITELLPAEPGHAWIWENGELFYWTLDEFNKAQVGR